MKKQHLFGLVLFGLLLVTMSAGSAQAQTPIDQLNYPACNCIPRYAGAFEGSGSDGFMLYSSSGIFLNYDDDENEQLFCPIAYDHRFRRADGTMAPIEIQVDVIDLHAGDEVRVDVFGRTTGGNAVLLRTENTSNPFKEGWTTLTLTVTPSSTIRYIWLSVDVPDTSPYGVSGVIGYRIRRVL
jgi:hypothetical protein